MGQADVDWAFTVDMAARTYTVRDARDSRRKPATFALPGKGPVSCSRSNEGPAQVQRHSECEWREVTPPNTGPARAISSVSMLY